MLENCLQYANKITSAFSFILGDSEIASGKVQLKHMESGESETVVLQDLIHVLKKKCRIQSF